MLQQYTTKLLELELFKKNNDKVFKDYENLIEDLNNLKAELQKEAREKGDMENDTVKVTKSERFKKYYDHDSFVKKAGKEELMVLSGNEGIKSEIIKPIFDELVEAGKISKETKQACFREEAMGCAILIKHKI